MLTLIERETSKVRAQRAVIEAIENAPEWGMLDAIIEAIDLCKRRGVKLPELLAFLRANNHFD